MIEFYLRIVDLSLFRQGEPVEWRQSINDLSSWSDHPIHTLVRIRMPIDEVDFIQLDAGSRSSRFTIIRKSPLNGELKYRSVKSRHKRKVKNGNV